MIPCNQSHSNQISRPLLLVNSLTSMPILHTILATTCFDLNEIYMSSGKDFGDLRAHEIMYWIGWVKAIQPKILTDRHIA